MAGTKIIPGGSTTATSAPVAEIASKTAAAGVKKQERVFQAPEPPPASLLGVQNVVATALPETAAPEVRRIDPLKASAIAGKGHLTPKLALTPGAEVAGITVPALDPKDKDIEAKRWYLVLDVATAASGEVDYEKSTVRLEDGTGKIITPTGVRFDSDGHIYVGPRLIDRDVTQAVFGKKALPKKFPELVKAVLDRMSSGSTGRADKGSLIDAERSSYSAFFSAKKGTLPLAGDSKVEFLDDRSNIFMKGDAKMGMVQINSSEDGAKLHLATEGGVTLSTSAPSKLNLRAGYLRDDKGMTIAEREDARFVMFDDSTLNGLRAKGTDVDISVKELTIDGHDAAAAAADPRWQALQKHAAELGCTVPPSEASGSDIELQVMRQFVSAWPLGDMAARDPKALVKLLREPKSENVTGFFETIIEFFGSPISQGVQDGLDKIPYFVKERLDKMPRIEAAIVVQRAVIADLLQRYSQAPNIPPEALAEATKVDTATSYAARYLEEVEQLESLYKEAVAQAGEAVKLEKDEGKRKVLAAKLASLSATLKSIRDPKTEGIRDAQKDLKMIQAVEAQPRPGLELPAYDGFALKFKRDGKGDANITNFVLPYLKQQAAKKGFDVSKPVTLDKVVLKPGVQPMMFLGLSSPLVKDAMRDPALRQLAGDAVPLLRTLAEGHGKWRTDLADETTLRKMLAAGLSQQLGAKVEPTDARVTGLLTAPDNSAPAKARDAILGQIAKLGAAEFETARTKLRELFVSAGGMEQSGRGEAFLSCAMDKIVEELKKKDPPEKDSDIRGALGAEKADAIVAKLTGGREAIVQKVLVNIRQHVEIMSRPNFKTMEQIDVALKAKITAVTGGKVAEVGSAAWTSQLQSVIPGLTIVENNKIEVIRGAEDVKEPANVKDGKALLEQMQSSIKALEGKEKAALTYWAIQDDAAGWALANSLIEQKMKERHIEISFVVDGTTSQTKGVEVLKAMEAAGIKVVRTKHSLHVKYAVFPDRVYFGDKNIGKEYIALEEPEKAWGGTNAVAYGPVVAKYYESHNELLKMCDEQPLDLTGFKIDAAPKGKAKLSIIDDFAGDDNYPHLALQMMMMKGAQKGDKIVSVNAYELNLAPLTNATSEELARGIDVEKLTNGYWGVDEPIVAGPIMDTARSCLEKSEQQRADNPAAGRFTSYMPKATNTEHSKLLAIQGADGKIKAAVVMSTNNHPRSPYVEHEKAVLVLGDSGPFAAALNKLIQDKKDGSHAIVSHDDPIFKGRKTGPADIAIDWLMEIF